MGNQYVIQIPSTTAIHWSLTTGSDRLRLGQRSRSTTAIHMLLSDTGPGIESNNTPITIPPATPSTGLRGDVRGTHHRLSMQAGRSLSTPIPDLIAGISRLPTNSRSSSPSARAAVTGDDSRPIPEEASVQPPVCPRRCIGRSNPQSECRVHVRAFILGHQPPRDIVPASTFVSAHNQRPPGSRNGHRALPEIPRDLQLPFPGGQQGLHTANVTSVTLEDIPRNQPPLRVNTSVRRDFSAGRQSGAAPLHTRNSAGDIRLTGRLGEGRIHHIGAPQIRRTGRGGMGHGAAAIVGAPHAEDNSPFDQESSGNSANRETKPTRKTKRGKRGTGSKPQPRSMEESMGGAPPSAEKPRPQEEMSRLFSFPPLGPPVDAETPKAPIGVAPQPMLEEAPSSMLPPFHPPVDNPPPPGPIIDATAPMPQQVGSLHYTPFRRPPIANRAPFQPLIAAPIPLAPWQQHQPIVQHLQPVNIMPGGPTHYGVNYFHEPPYQRTTIGPYRVEGPPPTPVELSAWENVQQLPQGGWIAEDNQYFQGREYETWEEYTTSPG
jgi:hypothetical protein